MQANEVLLWVFGGTTGAGLLAWLVRHLVITVFSGKSEVARIQAGDAFSTRLQEEIHRLEEIIEKQNKRIAALEAKIDEMRQYELEDLADIAEMNAIVEASCRATRRSRTSARSAPWSGCPLEKRLPATPCVCGRWSTPVSRLPKYMRLRTMPPTEIPPNPTP